MNDLLEILPENMIEKKKHAEKCRVSLWGQSLILKVVETYCRDLKKDYIRKILTCREF